MTSCSSKQDIGHPQIKEEADTQAFSEEKLCSNDGLNRGDTEVSYERFKRKYALITQEVREKFIQKVLAKEVTIKEAASKYGLKLSTAKAILHTYRNENRIGKKKSRNRKPLITNIPAYNQESVPVSLPVQTLIPSEELKHQTVGQLLVHSNLEKILIDNERAQFQQTYLGLNFQFSPGQYFNVSDPNRCLTNALPSQQAISRPLLKSLLQEIRLNNLIKQNCQEKQRLFIQYKQQQQLRNQVLLQNLELRSQMALESENKSYSPLLRLNTSRNNLPLRPANITIVSDPITFTKQVSNSVSLEENGINGSFPIKRVFY